MTNRRQFLASGIAISGAAVLPVASLHAGVGDLMVPGLELFVFDKRFEEAVALAQQAAQQGIPLAETAGDLMELWYDHLDLRWKEAPMTLAGVTTAKALFVLETLAADRRMAVMHREGTDALEALNAASLSDTALVSWIIAPRVSSQ